MLPLEYLRRWRFIIHNLIFNKNSFHSPNWKHVYNYLFLYYILYIYLYYILLYYILYNYLFFIFKGKGGEKVKLLVAVWLSILPWLKCLKNIFINLPYLWIDRDVPELQIHWNIPTSFYLTDTHYAVLVGRLAEFHPQIRITLTPSELWGFDSVMNIWYPSFVHFIHGDFDCIGPNAASRYYTSRNAVIENYAIFLLKLGLNSAIYAP